MDKQTVAQAYTTDTAAAAAAKSLQLCPTLCDPIDGSPPGSPVPGILQARTTDTTQKLKRNYLLIYVTACINLKT